MPYDPNPVLHTPDDDTILWRYMDFARFVQMLESQELWFSRADQFEDPFEGTFTDGEWKAMITPAALDRKNIQVDKGFLNIMPIIRYTSYLSCWRMGQSESLAMWDLYGKSSGIVAVTTTVGCLKKEFNSDPRAINIGAVEYIDWESAPFHNNGLMMMMRKDWSYSHEAEVRILLMDTAPLGHPRLENWRKAERKEPDNWTDILREVAPVGHSIKVNLASLVSKIWVGPREKSWIAPLVQKILDRYGLHLPIAISDRLVARSFLLPFAGR